MTELQDFSNDALGDSTEVVSSVPSVPPVHQGGHGPLIESKRKELAALEDKMERHRETGAYVYRTASGKDEFDNMAYQEDMVRIQRLNRELDDLRRKQDDHARLSESRRAAANETARMVFKRESARMPADMQKPVAEQFARIFTELPASEWARPIYADRAVLEQAILQLIDTAIGRARRTTWQGSPQSGLDGDGQPEPEKPVDDVDDFTNNVLYAYEQRQKQSMTIAQRRRAEAEANSKGGRQ